MKKKKIVTFGEIMLRLTTPDNLRIQQSHDFLVSYGGSEAYPTMRWEKLVCLNSVRTISVHRMSLSEVNVLVLIIWKKLLPCVTLK